MKTNLTCLIIALFFAVTSGFGADYYVSPGGSDGNPGSKPSPFKTLQKAVEVVSAGDYIFLRGGTHLMTSPSVVITKNGTSSANIHVFAYNGETPVLSFDNAENPSSRGIVMDGDHWHWKGITIEKAGDNGMLLSGNNNTIEDCIFRKNHDTGLQLSRYFSDANQISEWPSNNLILNCESFDNADSNSEDADGFAAKLTCGTGNIFRGCVAHHNIDDGWDLYTKSSTGPIGIVVFEDCIAHNNGTLTDGNTSGGGDKNGFKLGSSAHNINHELRRCIAFNNGKHGFTDNGNLGNIKFYNLTSYNNGDYNYHTRDGASHTFRNCITLDGNHTDRIVGDAPTSCNALDDTDFNWGYTASTSDFQTMVPGPDNDPVSNGFLNLSQSSQLIDAGCSVSGISGNGALDLGAIEYGGPPSTVTYTLSTHVSGSGTVTGGGTYDEGTTATVIAGAANGWSFSNWSGNASGTSPSANVYMNGNKSVTAVFVEDGTTDPPATGDGDVIHNFTESGTNSDFFNISGNLSTSKGTVVYNGLTLTQCLKIESSTSITFTSAHEGTLTLVFNDGFNGGIKIDGTSIGASSGILTTPLAAGSHEITKDNIANLYYISLSNNGASTGPKTYRLSTSTSGSGTVSGAGTYDEGTTATLTASPSKGWSFSNWSGDASGSTNPLSLTIDGDKAITAVFTEDSAPADNITIRAHGTQGDEQIRLVIDGSTVAEWTLTSNFANYTASGSGNVQVQFVNDNGARDVRIDYAIVGGTTLQAEDQETNTGVWQDGSCGGSYSEWLHCNGYIGFGDITSPTGTISLTVSAGDGQVALNWASTNISNNYQVYRDTDNDPNGRELIATVSNSVTSYTDTDVANGTTYYYWVKSVDISGNTVNSEAVSSTPVGEDVEITLQENQAGFCAVDGSIDINHSGFTGDGFANTDNSTGNGIDYKINVATAGSYSLEIRYANGSSDRPAYIILNGSTLRDISMPGTGSWATWSSVNTSIDLNAGTFDLRIQATSSGGLANIDYIKLTGANVSSADCENIVEPTSHIVSTSTNGSGTVSGAGTYNAGSTATLTASASTGYIFSGWSGDASGSSTPLSVTVNSDLSIIANFTYTGGSETPNFALAGWATQNGGTTGGTGGTIVNASTGDQILAYIGAKKNGAYQSGLVIMVNGTITSSNTNASKIDIKEVKDVSLIGEGTKGEFDGIGIKVYKSSNIIIRNLKVHHVLTGDKDCISIEGPADHIWVDHCELYNEFDNAPKDYYDALLDVKRNAEYLTYSWNYLHDSWKTSLVGSSESDTYDRKITMHHNYYRNCNSRLPLFRGGNGHLFNNYWLDIASTGINSRLGACIRIEGNCFEDVHNPIVSAYSDELGAGELIDNTFINCTWDFSRDDVNEIETCSALVPYSYSIVLNSTATVKDMVIQHAGVGKLSDPANFSTVKSADEPISAPLSSGIKNLEVYPNPLAGSTTIKFSLASCEKLLFKIYDITGRAVDKIAEKQYFAGKNTIAYENPGLKPGIYILSAQNGSHVENLRLVIE